MIVGYLTPSDVHHVRPCRLSVYGYNSLIRSCSALANILQPNFFKAFAVTGPVSYDFAEMVRRSKSPISYACQKNEKDIIVRAVSYGNPPHD